MKKPELISAALRALREKQIPSIDGSYVLLCNMPSPAYAAVSHPAYTPAQIKAQSRAPVAYFIRDTHQPAPYWIGPARYASRRVKAESGESVLVPHVVFDVAQSRAARRNAKQVAIPLPTLAVKSESERGEYILEQIRSAVALILECAA